MSRRLFLRLFYLTSVDSTSKYVGKVLRVHPGSLMTTEVLPHAASENAMAMRWSSYVSMATPGFKSPSLGGVMMQ